MYRDFIDSLYNDTQKNLLSFLSGFMVFVFYSKGYIYIYINPFLYTDFIDILYK